MMIITFVMWKLNIIILMPTDDNNSNNYNHKNINANNSDHNNHCKEGKW